MIPVAEKFPVTVFGSYAHMLTVIALIIVEFRKPSTTVESIVVVQ